MKKNIIFLWFSYGFLMLFLWFCWFSYGFPMVFLWFSYGTSGWALEARPALTIVEGREMSRGQLLDGGLTSQAVPER